MTNKQERGAIMLEVLAVLALIGVMGPMLYKQVLSRNQEISNVNIAAEMRAIKEAMSAAIAADSAILAKLCEGSSTGGGLTFCDGENGSFQTAVEEFLPIGMDGILDADYGYTIELYSQKVTLQNEEEYPILVGVVAGADLASDWTFKRTARIANLIGTDGGVVQGPELLGAGGSWKLTDGIASNLKDKLCDSEKDCYIVVATTAMDTFDPDLGVTDPNAVFVPHELGVGDLHAWNYFSVGAGNQNCIDLEHDTVGASDTIYRVGQNGGQCDPLFWVDGNEMDLSKKGHVYVKNNLYIGLEGDKKSFAFERKDATGNNLTNNRFVVYNMDCNEKLEINDKGQIIAKDKTVTIPIKNAAGTVEDKTYNYGLDPANTSVLNDVRLASRGGARLSDILPNYIAKGMYQLSSTTTGSNQTWSTDIKKPACPENYVAAVTVTPLKWGASAVQRIVVPQIDETSHNLAAPSGGGKVTGTINAITVEKANITQYSLAIEISGGNGADNRTTSTSATPWTVTIGYKNDSGSWDGKLKAGEIQALAQTYCVYAPNDTTYDPNALTGDKISDNLKQ